MARARQLIEEHGFEDAVTILEGVIAEDITDGLNKDAAEALNDAHEAWAKADCETGLALLARARRLAHERRYWEAEDTLDEISQLRYGRRLDGHIQDLLRTIGQAQQFIRERYAPATDTSVMVAIGGALMAMLISLFGFGLSTPLCVWISVMSFGLLHGLSGYFRGGSWIAHDGNLHCGALAGACGANLAFVALLAALQVPMLPGWVVTAVLTGIGFAMLEAGMDRACPARVPRRRDTHYTDRQVDEHEHHLEPRYIDNF